MRKLFLSIFYLVLAVLSLLTLKSVAPHLLERQLLYFLLGYAIFYLTAKISFFEWKNFSLILYALLCLVLFILLVVGKTTRGISAWISLPGGFKLQPSQMAIPFTTLFIFTYLKTNTITKLKDFLILLAFIAFPAILILAQPDLGTALVFLASVGSVIFLLKIPIRYLLSVMFVSLVLAIFAWNFVLKDYQKDRLTGFTSGYTQENSASFNARQSLISVGSGKFLGRGLGFGVQSHLKFLPERQTDFIFASLAEEWGFLGSVFIISLYMMLSLFLIMVALNVDDFQLSLFSIIMSVMITVQAGINMGMNMGILPITGITLPLLSYGGSSILAISFMLGLVQSIINHYQKKISLEIR